MVSVRPTSTLALLLLPAAAWSQAAIGSPSVAVGPPALGTFFDQARQRLQSLAGIPESGFRGDVMLLPAGVQTVEVSPAQDFVLAVQPEGGGLTMLHPGADSAKPVPGAQSAITRIAISPAGTAAVVYSEASRRAQILRGLPESPEIAQEFDWSGIPGKVTTLAVNDAGDFVLMAAQASFSGLYAVSASTGAVMIYDAGSLPSIAFFRGSRQALVASPAESRVVLVRDSAGTPRPAILADAAAGVQSPRVVAASSSGDMAFVVDAPDSVLAIPLSGDMPSRVSCDCSAAHLLRLRGRDVFLLSDSAEASLTVFDAGGPAIRAVRLRAVPTPAEGYR